MWVCIITHMQIQEVKGAPLNTVGTAKTGVIDFDLVEVEVEKLWENDDSERPRRQVAMSEAVPCCAFHCLLHRARSRGVSSKELGEEWIEDILVHMEDSGDVLLFKSEGTFPQLIRAASKAAAMNGRYDHVGKKDSAEFWPDSFSAKSPPLECTPDCSFDPEDLTIVPWLVRAAELAESAANCRSRGLIALCLLCWAEPAHAFFEELFGGGGGGFHFEMGGGRRAPEPVQWPSGVSDEADATHCDAMGPCQWERSGKLWKTYDKL
eukprot:Skav212181  [mRNA]  locus=scaffold754:445409:452044:+ [translate_table: standard]